MTPKLHTVACRIHVNPCNQTPFIIRGAALLHPEPVSHAADRFDEGAIGVGFDPLAEFGDVLVQGARFWEVVQSPAFVEDRIAIHHLTGAFMEQGEDGGFARREFDVYPIPFSAEFGGPDGEVSHDETP